MKKHINFIMTVLSVGVLMGCEGFLDERPDKTRLIPDSIADLQALLDNEEEMNRVPAIGILSSDDMVMNDIGYNNFRNPTTLNGYIWNADIFEGTPSVDWNIPYRAIFIANVVLEKVTEFEEHERYSQEELAPLKGMALFFRAQNHFQLAQIFAKAYDPSTASSTLGVPLRVNTNISAFEQRASLEKVYEHVVADLIEAQGLLPEWQAVKTRPSRKAVEALLARIYLTMQNYVQAEAYADLVLGSSAYQLMDYAQLNPTVNHPFPPYNSEVIWHSRQVNIDFNVANPNTFIHPEIFEAYDDRDLRKSLYSTQRADGFNFRGSYTGTFWFFGGIGLDEVYFIGAEAKYRNAKTEEAMDLMDEIMVNRFEVGAHESVSGDMEDGLAWILKEKRKSLIFRGTNWMDLRRLNLDPSTARRLSRTVNEKGYILEPNSNRYVFPIPQNELNLNPMEQNIRD
ncbi:RagB/SusD family nutrient uptake outer membrane protein [Litoribacter populi]|uniref:RagB/SusD family nutrient uptake outer membrane protein n=1 Tax=Litoribacter populi TaxID=2598460 RepID=UPI00117F3BF7|nr:RagB/SusD family nutrient uptake outer membrane protein [Litoribacter populi]